MAKKWIQNLKKGTLTAQAKRKGMTPAQFCSQSKSKLSAIAQKR